MKNFLLKLENVLIILNHTFQDNLTHYQGNNGHGATSDASPWKGWNTLSSVTPMTQRWWMHFPLCPWGWRQGVSPPIALHIAGTWRGNPPFVIVALAVAVAIAIAVAISIVLTNSVAITIAVAHCLCCRPLPLRLPATIVSAISVALPSAIAVAFAVALAVSHCRLQHHRPSHLQSPLAMTVTVAIGHFWELLPWRSKNCIWPIEAKNAYFFCFVWTVGGALIKAWWLTRCWVAMANTSIGWRVASIHANG